jgi:hypothetical protein
LEKGTVLKLAGFLLFFALVGLGAWLYKKNSIIVPDKKSGTRPRYVTVLVYGEVNDPGSYEVRRGSKVEDAVNKAGGLTGRADISGISFSRKIFADLKIIIPAEKSFWAKLGIGKSPPKEYLNPKLKIEKTE